MHMNTRLLSFLLSVLTTVSSCAHNKSSNTIFSPHYSCDPIVLTMEKGLDEISGLSFDPSDYSAVYVISDDKGTLYKVSVSDGKIINTLKFDKKKNFEDLVVVDDNCYVLNSNGNIISFNYKTGDVKNAVIHHLPEGGKNEFETLYQDKAPNKLVLICKG